MFPTYTNHPNDLEWRSIGKGTCEEVSFSVNFQTCNFTKNGTAKQVFYAAICDCKSMERYLYDSGNIGR